MRVHFDATWQIRWNDVCCTSNVGCCCHYYGSLLIYPNVLLHYMYCCMIWVLWRCSKDSRYCSSRQSGGTADSAVLKSSDCSETLAFMDHSRKVARWCPEPRLSQHHRGSTGEHCPLSLPVIFECKRTSSSQYCAMLFMTSKKHRYFIVIFWHVVVVVSLQCFDAVGWAAGRASGL